LYIATVQEKNSIKNYINQVDSNVILIDFMKIDRKNWQNTLEKCSGLLLSGGNDIHPVHYGNKSLIKFCKTEPKRDLIELELLNKAFQDSIPILGICRGMQLINVYFKGKLCVDIPSFCKSDSIKIIHRDLKKQKDVFHSIKIDSKSDLFSILSLEKTIVNSWHHQAISVIGQNLRISAISPDNVIEGIEWSKGLKDRWILGVQWHPERFYKEHPENLKIINDFIDTCKDKK
jgi:putative glutamine amidotransferase